ncbi:MAG: hypothetical protein NTW27_14625 [Deltaproteobacteria bacterium]|nr:hypothetical protein [Deltaproteobacteria bacterium]
MTETLMADLNLNKRQRKAISLVKANGQLTNADLRNLTGAISRTVARDLDDLVRKGVLEKVGQSGRRVHYVAARKQDINRTYKTSPECLGHAKVLKQYSFQSYGLPT